MVESPAAMQEVAGSSLLRIYTFFYIFCKVSTKSAGNLNTFKIVRDRFLDDYIKYNGL